MSLRSRRNCFTMPTTTTTVSQTPARPHTPLRKQSLNLAQTAYLAHTTRRKLSTAASRADHDLRVLVGHANFLDSLLLELAEAHKDQERGPAPSPAADVFAPRRVEEPKRRAKVADSAVVKKPVDDWEVWESEESESDGSEDSDSGDEKGENGTATMTAKGWVMRPGLARSDAPAVVAREVGEDDDDDDDYDYGDLALVRTLSHSPPEFLDNPFA